MKSFKALRADGVLSAVLSIITLLSLSLTPILCTKRNDGTNQGIKYEAIINVWHTDTFDGGVGSRASFLQKRADEFSKKHKGVLVFVTTRTPESIVEDFKKGVYPDAISYGIGGISPNAFLELRNKNLFDGGETGGKFYAAAYLRGQYFLFTHGDEIDNNGEIIVYSAENYSTATAAVLSGINGKYVFSDKAQAARYFLNNKNASLIGTQRDLYRLKAANVQFKAVPLSVFCDLYQYLSVITTDNVKNARIVEFLDFLLSEETQVKTFGLMMLPVKKGISADITDEDIKAAYISSPEYTLSPYLHKSEIVNIKETSEKALTGGDKDKVRSELIELVKSIKSA